MKIGKYTPSQIRKFLVAASGLVGLLLTSFLEEFVGIIPDAWAGPITWAVGLATAVGVFLTRNAPIIDAADNLE